MERAAEVATVAAADSDAMRWVVELLNEAVDGGDGVTVDDRAEARLAVTSIVDSALEVTEALYRVAGTTGTYTASRLQRCFTEAGR